MMTALAADDRGFTVGDGLFETVLAVDGALVAFSAHAARMREGCAELGLPAPEAEDLLAAARSALAQAGLTSTRAAVRLSWSAGSGGRGLPRPETITPRLVASAAPAPRPAGAAHLVTAAVRRNDTSPASRLKTLSYIDNLIARREASLAGADEALMLNTRNDVACASVANIFWIEGRRLLTPPVEAGVLPGIARAEVMAAARASGWQVNEIRAPRTAILASQGAFLTNSLIGARVIASLDGEALDQQVEQVMEWVSLGRR